MARCKDCSARLIPLFNVGRCHPCGSAFEAAEAARARAEAEKRYRGILRFRDRLNARWLPSRVAYGASRGALLAVGHLLGAALFVLAVVAVFADGPGEPRGNIRHINWPYVFWWVVLSGAAVGAFFLARALGAVPASPWWALLVPVAVAAVQGAWFGAGRAARREWGWWLDLDPPPHLADVPR